MILGANNTGYEVANHLAGNASIIHVVSGEQPVRMAWNTHFVGKSETIYVLKALRYLTYDNTNNVHRQESRGDGKICAFLFEKSV